MALCKGSLGRMPYTFFQLLSVWAHISSSPGMTKLFTLKYLYRLFFVFCKKNFHIVGWQQATCTAIVIVDWQMDHNIYPVLATSLTYRVGPSTRGAELFAAQKPTHDTPGSPGFTIYLPAVKPGPVLDTGTLRIINAHFLMV